jgi:hypothetical protein
MKLSERLHSQYMMIRKDCSLVTAVDNTFAPYLYNTLASIHQNFREHPMIYVYDLGMSWAQRRELSGIPWLTLRQVDRFAPHWKQNWSWKPYILTQMQERFVLYFDGANIVLQRPLDPWFLAIQRHGYFVIYNGQKMSDITPSDYWPLVGLDPSRYSDKPTFHAGLIGFASEGIANRAIHEAFELTKAGWNLGSSAQETHRGYDKSAIRDCRSFRADQTLLNLTFRKHLGEAMIVRDYLRYIGAGGPHDHAYQYIWQSRRKKDSLTYYWRPLQSISLICIYNRCTGFMRILAQRYGSQMAIWLQRSFPSLSRILSVR